MSITSLQSQRMSRRNFSIGAVGTAVGVALFRSIPVTFARQADLASLGYPTIDLTITAAGFEGLPETLTAGRYLVNATVAEDAGFGAASFLSPFGMGGADFIAAFAGGGAPEGGASPAAEGEGPAEDPGPMGLPPFIYKSSFAGGVAGPAGAPLSAVIDLPAGEWVLWGDDPTAPQAPALTTVTGDFPADAAEPEADVNVLLLDFEIQIEGSLTAGDHVFRIDNQGAQPHFLSLFKVPDGTTNEQIGELVASEMTGTPVPGLSFEDIQDVGYSPTQSLDTRTWTKFTLEAGTYGAACFFPRAGVGDPHALHGMHVVFEVS